MTPPTPEKHTLVNALVDSFDAPACLEAALQYAGPRTGPQGSYHSREFAAPVGCIYQLTTRAKALGFSEVSQNAQTGQNTYTGQLSSGSEDRITLKIADGENAGVVEWEVALK